MVELIPDSPFHAGEQAVQARLGVREGIDPWARKVIRPTLPGEHRAFYEALPYVIAAARDATGRPVVLVSAGIGITPMLSMLHEVGRERDCAKRLFRAWRSRWRASRTRGGSP